MQAGSDLSAAHLIAVRCARLKGDYDESRQYLRTAIAKRPAFGEAWQLLLDIESQSETQAALDEGQPRVYLMREIRIFFFSPSTCIL